MIKKIVSNTIIFIFIIALVIGFGAIFGSGNTLVGVTIIVSILVLMRENLTEKPLEKFLKLICINVGLGLFAHIASQNIWLGLILTFIALSGIGYFLSYNLNKVIIIPFGLQYLFMLYTPVSGNEFTKRILALIFGAILIMAVQFIIHRKNKEIKVEKSELIDFEEESDCYKEFEILGKIYKIHTVRARYAIRIGFVAAITAFIAAYFKLDEGRWMVYTIFSLTELYSEHCKIRSKERLQGTIIGALIILVLFMFIKDNAIRGLVVLISGYLDSYTNNYRDKTICITISVIASVSLTHGTIITIIERIVYVFIGIVFALAVNKFILQTKLNE